LGFPVVFVSYVQANYPQIIQTTLAFTLFALFHSLCAQEKFKDYLTRVTSEFFVDHFWRLIYVLISLKLYFVFTVDYLYENTRTETIVELSGPAKDALFNVSTVGKWLFTLALVELDFLYYFGLKQFVRGLLVLAKVIKKDQWNPEAGLKTGFLYRVVRHPLYASLLVMLVYDFTHTNGLLLNLLLIIYLIIGLPVEERKLIRLYGKSYIDYQKRTPAMIPFLKAGWWKNLKS